MHILHRPSGPVRLPISVHLAPRFRWCLGHTDLTSGSLLQGKHPSKAQLFICKMGKSREGLQHPLSPFFDVFPQQKKDLGPALCSAGKTGHHILVLFIWVCPFLGSEKWGPSSPNLPQTTRPVRPLTHGRSHGPPQMQRRSRPRGSGCNCGQGGTSR